MLRAKGSQNQQFLHQDTPKSQNMISRMRHQKKFEVLIEIWSSLWMCWIHQKCFPYKHFGGFSALHKNQEIHWKLLPKWCPKCSKIELGGWTIQVLGLETKEWKLVSRKWTSEARKSVTGSWKMVPVNQYPVKSPSVPGVSCRVSPDTPRNRSLEYINRYTPII